MTAPVDHLDAVLDELRRTADPRTWELVEEALRLVTELHGEGFARVIELAADDGALVGRLLRDELTCSLLILHGLHPVPLEDRVLAAIESVRPYLGSHGGGVEVLGLDPERGLLRLRMLGSCDGCPSSAVTLEHALRRALAEQAPEIADVELEQPRPAPAPVLLTAKP
jgi:Fe-S cluster biogenesis protein NfuA